MMEQGTRVMSAVHKRLHYAMRQEFKILARVMSESLPQQYPYTVPGGDETSCEKDFDDRVDVVPVSNLTYLVRRSVLLWRRLSCSLRLKPRQKYTI